MTIDCLNTSNGLPQVKGSYEIRLTKNKTFDSMVFASRASGCLFVTPKPLKSTPQDTHFFLRRISLSVNLKHIIEFFHLHIISMLLYMYIMPYFDKFIDVYG